MRGRLVGWAAVLVCLVFAITEAFLLNARIRDFDEGVYWQSLRALARAEPLFRAVFASQPPGFFDLLLPFYLIGRSVESLRLAVLLVALAGLVATYLAGRLLAGPVAALIALVLAATSPLLVHQSAIVQADAPSVALSTVALCLALLAVRSHGRPAIGLALGAGVILALAIGIKFLSVVTVVPVAMVLLMDGRPHWRLLFATGTGGLAGFVIVMLPAIGAPGVAFNDLVVSHLRAGQLAQQDTAANVALLLLDREEPLEALALIATVIALLSRNAGVLMPLVWVGASILAALTYHPLFPHHLVMLTVPLALMAAIGLGPRGREGRRDVPLVTTALVLATAGAGIGAIAGEVQPSMGPDVHDMEMAGAVDALSRPGDFWISDNPFAVALANRDLPGPLVDASSQRIRSGHLTVNDLEAARVRYHVRWLLEDSFRFDNVPDYRPWLNEHFHAVLNLGGRAVIYAAD
jgi:4-amino-4-deoxy-L-arabinose transferase-like glycosyltransferase